MASNNGAQATHVSKLRRHNDRFADSVARLRRSHVSS